MALNRLMDFSEIDKFKPHVDRLGSIRREFINRGVPFTSHLSDYWGRMWEYSSLISELELGAGKRVLDVGGVGTIFDYYLSELGCDLDCLDMAQVLIDQFDRLVEVFPHYKSIRNHVGFAQDLHSLFEENTFDHVVSVCVIEHLPTRAAQSQAMIEMIRVLKPGGTLGMSYDVQETSGDGYQSPEEIGPFRTPEQVRNILIDPVSDQATLMGNEDLFHPADDPNDRPFGGTDDSIAVLFLEKK